MLLHQHGSFLDVVELNEMDALPFHFEYSLKMLMSVLSGQNGKCQSRKQ